MAKRECPSLQKSLDWCEGTPQYPGIRRRVYYCNKNLITGWPTLQRDDFGRVTDATYQGEFTLAADATWQYIDINIDKSTVTSEPQGEVPSQTQLNKATSDVIAVYVYEQGIVDHAYSYSTAIGLFNTVINIILLIVVNKIAKQAADVSFV